MLRPIRHSHNYIGVQIAFHVLYTTLHLCGKRRAFWVGVALTVSFDGLLVVSYKLFADIKTLSSFSAAFCNAKFANAEGPSPQFYGKR